MALALGMFIPLELNVPLVVGVVVNSDITSRSKDALSMLNMARKVRCWRPASLPAVR